MTTRLTPTEMGDGVINLYNFVYPSTQTQTVISSTLICREHPNIQASITSDLNESTRKFHLIQIPKAVIELNRPLTFDLTTILETQNINVVAGSGEVEPLNIQQELFDLRPTKILDYDNPIFQRYLKDHDLLIKVDETASDFAHRAYRILATEIAPRCTQKPGLPDFGKWFKASGLCQSSCEYEIGCGGNAVLFTSTMRANGIPSRLLVGRWAQTYEKGGYHQAHVKSDFYDPSVGYIPVDQSAATDACFNKNEDALHGTFGHYDGSFITMHTNSDARPDTHWWGWGNQGGIFTYDGTGPFKVINFDEDWTVTQLEVGDAGPNTIWLGTLGAENMTTGWGRAQIGNTAGGHALSMRGMVYSHGIGTHAPSEMAIDLKGSATRFSALAGVDDGGKSDSSVTFEVWLDNKLSVESPIMRLKSKPFKFDVDLTGVKVLGLRVTNAGDSNSNDLADWTDAKIILDPNAREKPVAIPLTPTAK